MEGAGGRGGGAPIVVERPSIWWQHAVCLITDNRERVGRMRVRDGKGLNDKVIKDNRRGVMAALHPSLNNAGPQPADPGDQTPTCPLHMGPQISPDQVLTLLPTPGLFGFCFWQHKREFSLSLNT